MGGMAGVWGAGWGLGGGLGGGWGGMMAGLGGFAHIADCCWGRIRLSRPSHLEKFPGKKSLDSDVARTLLPQASAAASSAASAASSASALTTRLFAPPPNLMRRHARERERPQVLF